MQHDTEQDSATQPGLLAKVMASAVLLLVIACVLLQVFSRYSIHIRVSWTEELARFGLFAIAGVGGVLALISRSHFRMTILVDRVPARFRQMLTGFALLAATCLLFVITYAGTIYAIEMADSTTPMLRISYSWPYATIPLATLVMGCWSFVRLIALVKISRPESER
jgi:TRAP-type C4-dicarboxylate transport system permease small subunit